MKRKKMLWQFLLQNSVWVLICLGFNILSGYNKSVGATYLQQITDALERGDSGLLPGFVLVGGALTFSAYVIRWLGAVVPYYLSEKFACESRIRLFDCLCRIPFLDYERHSKGEYQSLLENDSARAGQMFYILLSRVMNNVFLFLFSIWVMVETNLQATVVTVFFVVVATGINQWILRFMKRHEKAAQEHLAEMTHSLESSFHGVETIKTMDAGAYAVEGYLERQRAYCNSRVRATAVNAIRTLWYAVVENSCLYGSIAYLGYLGLRGEMSIGSVLMFIYLIKQIIMPIEVIFRWMSTFTGASVSWERVGLQLEQEEDPLYETACAEERSSESGAAIRAEHITFSYDDSKTVLHDVTLDMKPGCALALKGESGSGKTTLFKVLLGLYPSDTARYEVSGRSYTHLYGMGSYGALEYSLFPVSIYDNVALGDPAVTREDVEKTLGELGFGPWLDSLPEGLDTLLQDNVSGGQRQAISTARAILSRRPLLILDEPFSALDTEKEECLIRLLRREGEKRAVLLSSHREDVFRQLGAEKCEL